MSKTQPLKIVGKVIENLGISTNVHVRWMEQLSRKILAFLKL